LSGICPAPAMGAGHGAMGAGSSSRATQGYLGVDIRDVTEDQFAINSGFDIPRTKTSVSVTWEKDAWSATVYGSRLGKLPTSDSYDQVFDEESGDSPWIKATYRYNASLQYRFDDHSRLSLSVVNVFNKMPPKDKTYTAYPYYDVSWFDSVGRTINLQYTHKFGGSAL